MPKKVDGRKIFADVLERWGLGSIRAGGSEYYTVVTNLLIIEELRKLKERIG